MPGRQEPLFDPMVPLPKQGMFFATFEGSGGRDIRAGTRSLNLKFFLVGEWQN